MSITTTIKTPRHHDANRPFGATPMIKQPTKPTDPATLTICNDPLPAGRASPEPKYNAKFQELKIGQAVKCKPEEVGRIAGALKKWVSEQPGGGMVRSIKHYPKDGLGRVWWLEGAPVKRTKSTPTSH
jgi:hypothetical protein